MSFMAQKDGWPMLQPEGKQALCIAADPRAPSSSPPGSAGLFFDLF
jgi:hypothetical protein|tara:strand:- start:732 stop:869 length:138 start_codon:yes stop_codon:yes gene_type:complete